MRWCAIVQLPGGFRLLVGRDLEERERLHDIVIAAGRWSIAIVVVLGLAGGFFVTRRVLQRVDAMTATTQTIMAGDLSGRLPIAGTGDELDRLAGNLNAMLERIEALDARPQGGLRQHRARPQDAADAAAQSLRGGVAHGRGRVAVPRRARRHDRGIGRA